jgi:hypothetical protein
MVIVDGSGKHRTLQPTGYTTSSRMIRINKIDMHVAAGPLS